MKRKWVIWLIVSIVVLCILVVVIGGGLNFYLLQQQGQAADAARAPLPVVQIFYPPNMSAVPFGSTIPIGAEAFVPEGNQITLLQLWADGELVGEIAGGTTALTASWGWTPPHASEHTLVARAYNQEGGEATAAINVQVLRDLPDTDQDGIADQEDNCPEEVGAPEWNGCPPTAAGEIGDAWGPSEGNLAEELLEAIVDALGGDAPPAAEDPPAEDPPVVVPEPDPPPPPPMALVEVEALELVSAVGARDVYCYLTLTSRPVERVPSDAEGEFTELFPGNWNIPDFMGGAHGRWADVPEVGPLHLELDCWGHFSDDPLDPDVRHMGIISVDHGPDEWDGRELIAHGEIDANWFDLKYRLCRGECEVTTLPPPFGLSIVDMGGHYELSWLWEGEPTVDNTNVGFHVYRDGIIIASVPDNHPLNVIALLPAEVEPPLCDQEFRFEIQAVRGADEQLSGFSNPAWSISPAPCVGDNRVAVLHTFPIQDSTLWMSLEHFYTLSHTERVVVGAYPLIDGAPVSAFLFSWNGTSVGAGGGVSSNLITYGGTEPITTNGLRLFMLTVADGVNPGGDIIYQRDVAFDKTWQPGMPDLRIGQLYYPEGDDILRIVVRNPAPKPLENWEPTFAFYQDVGGVRTRIDALNSPPGLPPVTIMPDDSVTVSWPGWTPAHFAMLEPVFEVVVDPDNLVAEYSEENNIFPASKPNIQVALEKIRVLSYGANDAAGFGGCFTGLKGYISVGGEFLYFDGVGEKKTFPTVFDFYFPHELGIMLCPPQEIDVELELIPVVTAGSCTAACSDFFTAHGQPVFAEGDHTPIWFPPIPPWGTDYCSACYTLAGQTSASRDTNILNHAYAGGNLPVHVILYEQDVLGNGAQPTHTICNFIGEIPAGDMAALPVMNRTLTDPGGNCEIVVSVEPFP